MEKRSRYLVNRRFQFQLAGLMVVQLAVPVIILGVYNLLLNRMYLESLQSVIGQGVLSDAKIASTLIFLR